jgi:cytochrome c peroxidase
MMKCMDLRQRTPLITCLVAAALASVQVSIAAQPQVPSLPAQPAGYVAYAIDNLPEHLKNGPGAANPLDNTPADNLLTDAGATLGRVLFYDKRLSHDNAGSCASCHRQANGFSDPNQFSTGINGQLTGRHSMALANSTYYANGAAFWDERAESLEAQALIPIESPTEMGSTLAEVVAKLNQTAFYPVLFQAAFGSPDITPERIGKAIAQFERSMVSYQAKYDTAFPPGEVDGDFAAVFTQQELQGLAIFHGSGRCSGCHVSNAHVGDQARNVGLDATVVDEGVGEGRFKTPSLRNVAVRGRFMHDGRFASLEEVVEFYNTGVQDSPNLDETLRSPLQLNLTPQQVQALVAYLNALTDTTFLASPLFSDPFVTLPGDYDGSGEVNLADYNLWKANLGDATSLVADGNGNQVVDAADYVIWRKNEGLTWQTYGGGTGASSLLEAVPEPSALALAALLIIWRSGFLTRKPSRHRSTVFW